MTLPQPEIYRDYEIIPEFVYTDSEGDYTGHCDWIIRRTDDAEGGSARMRPCCALYEVKESIDDLLNQ